MSAGIGCLKNLNRGADKRVKSLFSVLFHFAAAQDPEVNVCYVCMNMTQGVFLGKKKRRRRKEQKFFPGQTHRRKLEGTQEKTKPPSTLKGSSKVEASIKSLFGYRPSAGFDFLNVKKKK